MLINFIKVAWRNIVRGRGFTLINITGLTVGMASAMLILLWVQDELSYDRWYANTDRLYQCWERGRDNQGITCSNITPQVLGPALKQEYPEVEQATRVGWDETLLFSVGDKKVNIRGMMTDPYFLTMFGFPFVAGDRNTALNNPNSVVLTQKAATVLFGSSDVVGKAVRLDNKYDMTVTAVMKDLPGNTQFDFEFILPWTYLRWTNQTDSSWGHVSTHNYVLLKPHTDLVSLNARLDDIYARHSADTARHAFLYPLSQLHLYPKFENGVPVGSKMESVRVFTLIAVLILLIACINFMNMSTARSEKRAREVGIRKVSGALRGSLIAQFLGESILLAAMAGGLALVVVELCLPAFNEITGKQMSIAFGNAYLWVFYAGFIVITGVVAGSYPAFFLSAFQPVSVLKGQFKKAHALITPRKTLVVVQFSFAVILIICTLIIQQQLRYVQDRETGFDRHHLIYTLLSGDMNQHYDMIKGDLLNKGIAEAVTKSSGPLSNTWSFGGADWPGKDPNDKTGFNYFNCDGDIVRAAGLHLIAGRDIDVRHYPTDSSAVILNEAAVRVMGFKNPIGQIINRGTWGVDWHVIGVVKDFILESPYDQIKPICIQGPKANWFNLIHIKFNPAHTTAESLAATEKVFRQYNSQYPFEYQFIDQEYAKKFSDEQKTETLTAFFAGLTIFISCLGLFGLAAYMAENRIKEIGVRKVLGASVVSITTLLSRDFLKLVVIAIVVASPIAWWSMNKWLAGYSYRMPIYWWIFVAAGASAVAIALLTVSFQAVRAAMANPVESLRSE